MLLSFEGVADFVEDAFNALPLLLRIPADRRPMQDAASDLSRGARVAQRDARDAVAHWGDTINGSIYISL